MAITLKDKMKGLSVSRRRKIEARTAELVKEQMTLRELRRARKLTQVRVAKELGITQDGVSRLEQRSDLLLSSLRKAVEAMGGNLSLVAEFPDRAPVVLSGIAEIEAPPRSARRRHTCRPEKCVGLHFFNPVPKMKLLEVVRGLETSEDTISTCREIGARMGKEVVVVREAPGFITSRINAMIGNEAFFMLEEGIATAADIDKALKLGLNHPMGPFELVDLVGLDVRLSILEYLHKMLGDKYRPAPLLKQYVKAGRLGRKSGRGVFDYPPAK